MGRNDPHHAQCSARRTTKRDVDDNIFHKIDDSAGNLPHPMNHFDWIGAQIIRCNDRWILRHRKTWKESIDDRQSFAHKFSRPVMSQFRIVHIDNDAGRHRSTTAIQIAVDNFGVCGRFCLCINLRHFVRINWTYDDQGHIDSQTNTGNTRAKTFCV